MEVRCKHCCKQLFKGDSMLLNAHYKIKQHPTDVGCKTDEYDCCSYMTVENVPDWILGIIEQVNPSYIPSFVRYIIYMHEIWLKIIFFYRNLGLRGNYIVHIATVA